MTRPSAKFRARSVSTGFGLVGVGSTQAASGELAGIGRDATMGVSAAEPEELLQPAASSQATPTTASRADFLQCIPEPPSPRTIRTAAPASDRTDPT